MTDLKTPAGPTLTFLFTDIEGSTQLWEQHPEAMKLALARHDAILRQAIEAHAGYVFKTVGDSFYAAFTSAPDAISAALDAQRALADLHGLPNDISIRVRMGLHSGPAEQRDNDYFGPTLNRVARLLSAGHGGQVLISTAIKDLVANDLPNGVSLRDMGERRLKDLILPEHIYQLVIPNLPADFAPLKTLDVLWTNLPPQLTSFVGREKQIEEVKEALQVHRLVTLTGSGGTGKTRLALQVAAELLEQFPHGVWFVELAPLTDPNLIPFTILYAIGVQSQPGKTPLETLQGYLQDKKTLVVLDNCEHLVSASAEVAQALLHAAPQLKILASSREALGVKGEMAYPVPSLALPNLKHLPELAELAQYEAMRLFVDRAVLVAPQFAVTKENAPTVAQICQRLDGVPLAIELAAARVKLLSVEQIAKRLDDRFRLLTGGARTALPRQQTLRTLIDWSYDLLTENERLLLRRLAVFAGGWTLEAAETVCAGGGVDEYEVLDLLTQLVNKSLVVVMEPSPSGETRYRMLETIRQYAREKLVETADSENVRVGHRDYFVRLAEQAEPELYRANQAFWYHKLDDEVDNFRLAVEWALATDVEAGLRIAATLWRFWIRRGYMREVEGWLAELLEQYSPVNALHSQALAIRAFCLGAQGNALEMTRLGEQSLQMARALADKRAEAFSLYILGVWTTVIGNVTEGVPLLEQSLALYRALGDKAGEADVIAWLSLDQTDFGQALGYIQESLRLNRELGNLMEIARSLNILARLTFWNGDLSAPGAWLEEALSIARQLGDQFTEVLILAGYGMLMYWRGDYQQAITYLQDAIQVAEKIGYHYMSFWVSVLMSYVLLGQGEIQQAYTLFAESIRNMHKAGITTGLIFAIEGISSLYVNQHQPERAARLFAWTDIMREKLRDIRPPIEQNSVERDIAVIHSQMNDATFTAAQEAGRAMSMDEIIALALDGKHD